MKNSRKCIFKSIVCMLLSIIIIGTSSIYSSAATTSYKKVSSGEKVGDYYIWIDEIEGLYTQKKGSSMKLIQRKPKIYEVSIAPEVITNGKQIYYAIITDNLEGKYSGQIYRSDMNGKNKKHIATISHLVGLEGYYGNKLYISRHSRLYDNEWDVFGATDIYSCSISSGKISLIKKNSYILKQNGKYLLLKSIAWDYTGTSIYCYNASTNKKYKINYECGTANFVNGKIYYSDMNTTNKVKNKETLKSCSYTGKNQKTIKTFNFGNYGGTITSINKTNAKYIKYNRDHTKNTMYKYYYKTGKTVKIK
ncbi:hypothetical protein [Intestinibacter bartlettii]|uniref:hypothetical protein n=1 Tax=Intestinibacter bartlettii TaxID=261299 RepID=UPI0022E6D7FA|nr:hypothetical protein [Intestinibacter bartlettii]MDU2163458.1 hypothetical protein [Intestinibacter bartlettii]MDU6821787.1 hypothetical protein [Intestinibacter bartlettii]